MVQNVHFGETEFQAYKRHLERLLLRTLLEYMKVLLTDLTILERCGNQVLILIVFFSGGRLKNIH